MRLPRIDASRAIGAYAAATTLGLAWFALGGAASAKFDTIDVQRINVREPDGTLRIAISNHAKIPGLIVGGKEYPHPNRPDAGMIFFNDEGIENGGLVFDGAMKDGKRTNGGSLTFDRYLQDQTVQLTSIEDGAERYAGMIVTDRPEPMLQLERVGAIGAMSPGPARDAAAAEAGFGGGMRRAFLGRTEQSQSRLDLSDAAGRVRLRLEVASDGAASIAFLNADGRVSKRVGAE